MTKVVSPDGWDGWKPDGGFFGSVVQYAWCLEKIKGRWYHAVIPATGVWFSVKEIL